MIKALTAAAMILLLAPSAALAQHGLVTPHWARYPAR